MKRILSILAAFILAAPLHAQVSNGPRTGLDGSIHSPNSSYFIHGASGVASFASIAADPRAFAAKCDGTTDDAGAINAALTYASTVGIGRVVIPAGTGCAIGSTITVPANTTLSGPGNGSGGLIARVTNLTMVRLAGDGAAIKNLFLKANAAGTNTAGAGVVMPVITNGRISNVEMVGPYLGMDLNGNTPVADHVIINDLPAGGTGWSIGRLTTGGNTVDPRINFSTVGGSSSSAAYGQIIYDAGGLSETGNDLLFTDFGTYIFPGANQQVIFPFFSNTILGDTNNHYGLVIDTNASTAIVSGLMCSNCWMSNPQNASGSSNLIINNSAGGAVKGIRFVGSRFYGSTHGLVTITAGTDISFDTSTFCGATTGNGDISIGASISGIAIRNNRIGGACDNLTQAATYGVVLGGSNTGIIITNNDFSGVTTPVFNLPSGDSVASLNAGLGAPPAVASAATLALTGLNPVYTVTGTTGVNTISGAWTNRQITLITTGGAVAFSTGGNICNALTSVQNVPVTAIYSGTCWYLK